MIFSEICRSDPAALPHHAKAADLVAYFQTSDTVSMCVLIDTDARPVGAVSRYGFSNRLAGLFGDPVKLDGPAMDEAGLNFMTVRLTDELDDATTHLLTNRPDLAVSGLVIVDDEGRYAGLAEPLDILGRLYSKHTQLIENLRDEIVERRHAERNARVLANSDPLTGLANRRAFLKQVSAALEEGHPFFCGFVDLDGFKQLNDEFGHAVGDSVLMAMGQRLINCRGLSTPARLGGDEFAFMIRLDADANGDGPRMAEVHDILTQPVPSEVGPIAVGASIGVSRYPEDSEDKSTLLHAADRSMLRAKESGGGVEWFDPRHDIDEAQHSAMEVAFRLALSRREIRPFFQPVLDMATNTIVGHEVLSRWPRSGFDPTPGPAVFLPIAERLGLTGELFWTVAEAAFERHAREGEGGSLALNISPSQIKSHEFISRLLWLLDRCKLPPERLELEVTERAMFRNRTHGVKLLHELSQTGISIVLDDFGTGYSSLSLVQDLPLTKLKIDHSFVAQLDQNNAGESIISATLSLCRELGITCCAEGVETKSQLTRLRELGCDYAQGYYIGRPTSALQHAAHNELDDTPAGWRTKTG